MTVTLHNIDSLPAPPPGSSHLTRASGDRIVHISGQVGQDENGAIVPGGLAAQFERAILNVGLALDAAEASEEDLAKMTFYVVDWDPSMLEELGRGASAAREHRQFPDVAVTLIGVKSLFSPEMLIEVEAVAVTD